MSLLKLISTGILCAISLGSFDFEIVWPLWCDENKLNGWDGKDWMKWIHWRASNYLYL